MYIRAAFFILLLTVIAAQNLDDHVVKYLVDSHENGEVIFVKNKKTETALREDEYVLVEDCPACEIKYCPQSEGACAYGIVQDRCGCCTVGVCRLTEGEKCLNLASHKNISETDLNFYGDCGSEMKCVVRDDMNPTDSIEALCICNDAREICGSNNITYSNICGLKKASDELGEEEEILIKNWGSCLTKPTITSTPMDVERPINAEIALDCEVQGFPIPYISWEFHSQDGKRKALPGDDPRVTVLIRGGPEQNMLTSWVQISAFKESDAGIYICVATNSEGETKALAKVSQESSLESHEAASFH